MYDLLLLFCFRLQRESSDMSNRVQSYSPMRTWLNILPYVSWLDLINPITFVYFLIWIHSILWFGLIIIHSFIWLNLFNYFESTGNYSYLCHHVQGGEDIFDELIPRAIYTGRLYPYITNGFGSSNTVWPRRDVYPKLELVLLLSISCVGVIYLYMFRHSECNI